MSSVTLGLVDGLATITLAAPRLNALDVELLADLRHTLGQLDDPAGVLLTGTGRAFSAGVDLDRILTGGRDYARQLLMELNGAVAELFELPMPVVAAINGHAIAGGCVLAMAADLRFASGGKIGLNELAIGVPFPPAALSVVHHVLGSRAPQLIYAADLHSVETAHGLGYIDEIVDAEDLLRHSVHTLERLAQIPRQTFSRTKRSLTAAARKHLPFSENKVDLLANQWTSPDMLERIARTLGR